MNKHLIVKPSAIGDVIMAIPAVEALKRAKGGEIWWICGQTAAPILARFDCVDKVILLNESKLFKGNLFERISELFSLWRTIVGVQFQTYAVLQYDWRYRLIGLPVRSKRRLLLKRGDRKREIIRGRSMTDEFARILLDIDGPIPDRLGPSPMPGIPSQSALSWAIGIVPGGARNLIRDNPLRRWPLEYYVSLAKLLINEGFQVLLLGAESDRWTLPAFRDLPVVDKLGSLSLTGSVELISTLAAFITHDTGLLHMAALTETRVVALFGPTNPAEFLPNASNISLIWGGEGLACRPCYDGQSLPTKCIEHCCLRSITPETVFEKVKDAIGVTAAGNGRGSRG